MFTANTSSLTLSIHTIDIFMSEKRIWNPLESDPEILAQVCLDEEGKSDDQP